MRLLLLLVLMNIALFGYFNMDKIAPKTQASRQELNPEKLTLLMDTDFATLDKKTLLQTPLTHCYKWGRFTETSLSEAQEVLRRLDLTAELIEETPKQDKRFWIYYPPLATAEKAKQKAEEIKKLGVDELFIVQDSQWRNAISFGLFSDETLANNLFKNLKAKGVKYALKSVRNQGSATSSLLLHSVSPEMAVALYKIRPEFVGTDIHSVACQL
jgi:hypothetical protein